MASEQFYDLSNPPYFKRGDLFLTAPLISLPPSGEQVVARAAQTGAKLTELSKGVFEALSEDEVQAPFDEYEYVIVSARRGMAVLMTQTCDLADTDHWIVSPLYCVEGSDVNPKDLFAGKYKTHFGFPAHQTTQYLELYADISDLRPVRKESIRLTDRVLSLQPGAENALAEKFTQAMSRRWGYRPGEIVIQSGLYRCNKCNEYFGIAVSEVSLRSGEEFPKCKNCSDIHKTPAWYILVEHKKT